MTTTKSSDRDRNDWVLLLFLLPLGILLMLFAGQRATRLLPRWILQAEMGSQLDPNGSRPGSDQFAAVRPEIGTPAPWSDTFLTPGADDGATATQPTFVVFPSVTPSPSATSSATGTATSTTTVTTTPPVTSTPTKKPKGTPTTTATATASPSPSPGVTSTIDPALTALTATPSGFNEGPPDGVVASPPDGSYFVVNVSSNPVVVGATPDGNYDLAYYEDENPPGFVSMDQVIIGISNDPSGNPYYEIFNWGDGTPDSNSNVDISVLSPAPLPASPAESDNAQITTGQLYGTPPNQTGILIDVDTAPSSPPAGTYNYVVIISPPASAPNNAGDGGQLDSVQVTEVALPP
jgi:hypothetical protein